VKQEKGRIGKEKGEGESRKRKEEKGRVGKGTRRRGE
jgi:hypothetical protein